MEVEVAKPTLRLSGCEGFVWEREDKEREEEESGEEEVAENEVGKTWVLDHHYCCSLSDCVLKEVKKTEKSSCEG